MPSSVEGMQKFVIVTRPQTATRIPPRISAAVAWPNAKSRPTASSQTVRQLEGVAARSGVGWQLRRAGQVTEAVVPDQVEGVAPGPAGDRADRDQGKDQDSGLEGEAGDDEREAERGREAETQRRAAALLGGQA